MNRSNTVIIAISAILITSCKPVQRSEFNGSFPRIATVELRSGVPYLNLDCTTETYSASNFRTAEDMKQFNVNEGDRGVAVFSYQIIPSADLYIYNLDDFRKFVISGFNWGECPNSEIGSYLFFTNKPMGDVSYPVIWSAGHHFCMTVNYYPGKNAEPKENILELYPRSMRGDTLSMLLYSNFPETARDGATDAVQATLDFDLSEIVQVNSYKAQEILSGLRKLGSDSIYVEIATCDSLDIIDGTQHRRLAGGKIVTRCAIDF